MRMPSSKPSTPLWQKKCPGSKQSLHGRMCRRMRRATRRLARPIRKPVRVTACSLTAMCALWAMWWPSWPAKMKSAWTRLSSSSRWNMRFWKQYWTITLPRTTPFWCIRRTTGPVCARWEPTTSATSVPMMNAEPVISTQCLQPAMWSSTMCTTPRPVSRL